MQIGDGRLENIFASDEWGGLGKYKEASCKLKEVFSIKLISNINSNDNFVTTAHFRLRT